MSSILKALKKLEQEKARRGQGSLNIAHDILRHGPRRKRRTSPLGVVPVVALALLAAVAGYLLRGDPAGSDLPMSAVVESPVPALPSHVPEPVVLPEPTSPPAVVVTPEVAPTPPLVDQEVVEEVLSPEPVIVRAPRTEKAAAPAAPVAEPVGANAERSAIKAAAPAAPIDAESSLPGAGKGAGPRTPAVPIAAIDPVSDVANKTPDGASATRIDGERRLISVPQTPPDPVVAAPPVPLVITAIAFQDDRRARLAVINGLPVMEGGVVAGARVEEILRDQVRLVLGDKSFLVPFHRP